MSTVGEFLLDSDIVLALYKDDTFLKTFKKKLKYIFIIYNVFYNQIQLYSVFNSVPIIVLIIYFEH